VWGGFANRPSEIHLHLNLMLSHDLDYRVKAPVL
jgi:hypothetical protein